MQLTWFAVLALGFAAGPPRASESGPLRWTLVPGEPFFQVVTARSAFRTLVGPQKSRNRYTTTWYFRWAPKNHDLKTGEWVVALRIVGYTSTSEMSLLKPE